MKGKEREVNEEKYDYCTDFHVLSSIEKRVILKTAKTLLEVQNEDTKMLILSKNEKNKKSLV